MAAAAVAGGSTGGGGAAALPVLELHNRAAELNDKVDAIEQNLRIERSKTEEMRRILADIKDRLNQGPLGGGGGDGGGSGLSPVESLTFPPANPLTYDTGLGPSYSGYSAFINTPAAAAATDMSGGGGGGLRYGSAAGVNILGPHYSDLTSGHQGKVRIFVDEDAIREQEQQRALQVLARQAEKLKQQMLREHQERRLATSVASSATAARASPQLQQMGPPAAAAAVAHGIKDGPRHSRQVSREVNPASRRSGARRSSPGKMSRPGSSSHVPRRTQQQVDDSSDSDHAAMAALAAAAASYGGSRAASRQGSAGGATSGGSRPPRPGLSRLSGPTIHGSLGDLPAAATMYGMSGDVTSASSRSATVSGITSGFVAAASNGGGGAGAGAGSSHARASAILQGNRFVASSAFGSISLVGSDKQAAAAAAVAAAGAGAGARGNISKASSFSDRMTQASQLSYRSASGWDAALPVAASAEGR
ncbi:hypothetical protein Vretimale_17721 [Volvox reticuliferus]|nr:hypothetical protein Vretifemale_18958 [Volvox reticuliferus]GIM14835.1 hypothetical protein Vretimale_17721 [Volvox reticuliferus]